MAATRPSSLVFGLASAPLTAECLAHAPRARSGLSRAPNGTHDRHSRSSKSNASLRLGGLRSGAEVQREERWGTGRSSDGAEPAALIVCGRRFKALLRRPRSAPSPAAPKVNRASGAASAALDHIQ